MKTINVRGYGSLVNAIGNQTKSLKPEVGMGVTELMYSDRHPYTIIAVLSEKKIQVIRDIATRTDKNGCCEIQEYTYTPDYNSPTVTLRLNKHGRWKESGHPDGSTFLIGRREEYYDFTR
jgi:hypothetical protein